MYPDMRYSAGAATQMKRVIFDSIQSARATSPYFIDEEGLGIWLGTDDPAQLAAGRAIEVVRDALHVPSVTRTGAPLSIAVRAEAIGLAGRIGLRGRHLATGYWTLSHNGELQTEPVLIVFSTTAVNADSLRQVALWLLERGDQDAVAIELRGRVSVVGR